MGITILKSRKFWAAIVGLAFSILAVVAPDFPVSEEAVSNGVGIVMAYILGVALEDGLSKSKTTKP
ncbi:MAG: hypothetical protein AB9907_17570 [Flexilinea sp.]